MVSISCSTIFLFLIPSHSTCTGTENAEWRRDKFFQGDFLSECLKKMSECTVLGVLPLIIIYIYPKSPFLWTQCGFSLRQELRNLTWFFHKKINSFGLYLPVRFVLHLFYCIAISSSVCCSSELESFPSSFSFSNILFVFYLISEWSFDFWLKP